MRRNGLRTTVVVGAATCLALAGSATAFGATEHGGARHQDHGSTLTVFQLKQLNHSRAHGIGIVRLHGNEADVRIVAFGLLADNPHAQHFHIDGAGQCPTTADDTNGDGIISTVEGRPAYGLIGTSLTTSGDTSPASGLAVDRFPTAPHKFVRYHRTIELSDAAAKNLRDGNAVMVLHGIDPNGTGAYDGDAPSELDPSLPLEATAPAACGTQTVLVSLGH